MTIEIEKISQILFFFITWLQKYYETGLPSLPPAFTLHYKKTKVTL